MWNTNDWSKCIIQKCPTPEIPLHGKAPLEENWVIGDKFKYQCKTGYFVKGNDVKVCSPGKKEGKWEGETPVCEAISCPALPSIVGGTFSVIQNGLKTEEETPYSVYDEVEFISRRRRSAFDSGFPSPLGQSSNYDELEDLGQSPSQQIHFPGQTPSPTYDDFTGQTSDGFDFDYGGQTNEGFDYIGQTSDGFDNIGQSPDGLDVFSQFPNYEEGGQSQGFDLEYSQIPDSFPIDTFSLDSIVEYSCRPGYKLLGSPKRRCSENGTWDQPEPICYEQHCQELKPLVNGRLLYFGSGSSSRVEFSCDEGYQLKGDSEIVCQNDRTWLGNIPYCERLSCEAPVEPENGTVEYTSTTFGSLATYDCFQGFVLEGSFTRHCGADGFWNGSTPRCIGVVCKTPSVIDKGYIYYEGNLNVGSIVEYGCNECYKLVGNAVRECQLDETWTLEEPRCDLIMCSSPPSSLQNGKVIGTSNSCGSLVEFECNPGYKMNGQRKASCMEDGEWTHPVPECEKVSCDSPPKLLNGKILGNSFKFSDQIIYECNEGYNINGNNMLTCDENGNWIGDVPSCLIVNCTKPKGPSNGRVRVTGLFYGASVNIVCDPGYKIEGESKLTCQANAQWDKEMPFCSPLICPPAPRPPHSSYNSSELYFESFTHLEYKCDLGFTTKIRNKILQCSSQAVWKGELIDCKPVDCGKPKNIKHGIIDGDKYTFGHIIDFSCFEGYKLIGEPKATCQSNGKWTDMPTCERITCGSPPLTPFGNVVMDKPEGDFNSSVHYECHRGYVLNGFPKIICEKSGEWSSLAPRCDPVLCPEPPEELNAVISGNVYEFDKNITYQCNEGFSMQGISTLTCLENGKWSSDFPVCDMIICEVPTEVPNAKWETKKLSEVPVRTEPLSAYKSFKGKKVRQRTKTSKTSKLTALLENQYESEHILYRFGHIIEYTCNEGHFKTTTGILECSELGWSTTPPQCHPITCPQPISIKNGRVIGDDVKFGSILKYECDEGYDLFGVSSRKCQANKEWTDIEPYCRPKECPRPAQLINGRTIVKSIKYQSVIAYSCDPGFRLEGHQTRVCQSDENWSGERPFCIEIFCEEPKKISHGVTDITSLKEVRLTLHCMEGYRMEGRSIINCQSDGEWDSVPPKCLRVNCGPPPGGSHLNMSFDSTFYASKVTYFCERGYRLEGNSVTTCLQSGHWSNKVPHCSIVTCDALPQPSNGFIIKI
ncbi:Sushi, von Willebrand factor type A, EGF and pentraxin domain-containing protein 1 [Armadillidium vulgare]|nr:Sushi, von Willebrand factor type A, EGF and pentraxin domain-containing protein 1 [Armadillidium vulgare]